MCSKSVKATFQSLSFNMQIKYTCFFFPISVAEMTASRGMQWMLKQKHKAIAPVFVKFTEHVKLFHHYFMQMLLSYLDLL